MQGTLGDELFWLRSWTEETYLWNDEVADQDPNTFADTATYFDELRTFETTPSGEEKDDFHFSQSTEEFLESRQSTPRSGYGASIIAFSQTVPRDFRIRYTEPGSPAASDIDGRAAFERGMRILTIDGVDLVNGGSTQDELDILNAGLFPATAGETHEFSVRYADGTERTISITSADVAPSPVNRTTVITTPTGDVGYMLFNTFSPFASEESLFNAVTDLRAQGIDDLVLDLRYNGGGLLAVASQLSFMIAGTGPTDGSIFEQLRYNDCDNPGCVDPIFGDPNSPIPFFRTGQGFSVNNGTPLPTLDLPRVFVLTTEGTCSASEAVINGLRGIDVEVILIGDTTCGKPFGFFPTDNCGETYFTIQFQGTNDKGFGDYADGFVPMNSTFNFGVRTPGCQVEDDFSTELGEPGEGLLAAALQYRADGTCPAVTASASAEPLQSTPEGTFGAVSNAITPPRPKIMDVNRDMRMPEQ